MGLSILIKRNPSDRSREVDQNHDIFPVPDDAGEDARKRACGYGCAGLPHEMVRPISGSKPTSRQLYDLRLTVGAVMLFVLDGPDGDI